jgi:hypothetical protein
MSAPVTAVENRMLLQVQRQPLILIILAIIRTRRRRGCRIDGIAKIPLSSWRRKRRRRRRRRRRKKKKKGKEKKQRARRIRSASKQHI